MNYRHRVSLLVALKVEITSLTLKALSATMNMWTPPSSSGLGHHPFKVVTRIRIPLGA